MPKGIYIKTKSSWNKGLTKEIDTRLIRLEETKRKISESAIERIKNGTHNLLSLSKKSKEKKINSLKKFYKNPEIKKRMSGYSKEYWANPENRIKKGESQRGEKHHFYNKHHTEDSKKNISISRKGKCLGEENSAWLGGISFEPYDSEFNNKFKRMIRKRDNHICMKCLKHQEKLSRTLAVHHINYDKKLSIPQNCISLCNSCNIEVNHNRPYWTKFFQSLLSEKYGYQYNENQEVILEVKERG